MFVTSDQKNTFFKAVDKAVCDWTMATGHSLTEAELNGLVDKVVEEIEAVIPETRPTNMQ